MTKISVKKAVVLLSVLLPLSAFASEQGLTCQSKIKAIQTQIAYAKANNNTAETMGLNTALADTISNCSDSSLEKKYQAKVTEKTAKVAERKADLAEAQAEGKVNKLAKLQRKIDSAQAELDEAQAQLDSFHQTLKAQ
ncbi:DUF1090 domain-containing protein [Utexia brackfieldae]|uniref:DUF1090 domain-containing protein n=1 Tax=Utexia brackfieldae TaxID=3074108 RepID=UPI00370D635A